MGKIEKLPGPKHEPTKSSAIRRFAELATELSAPDLPAHLASFPRSWPFPRGDLYNWIFVLNRFDEILARFISIYELDNGPQTKHFGRILLLEELTARNATLSQEKCQARLDELSFGADGDRELVESIINFSRLLLEKCGNRSLFNSSDRLNALLNTSSLSLLQCTLRVGVCLAQRYYSRHRATSTTHFHQSLLAAHYNFELERVQRIALPFSRPFVQKKNAETPTSVKGKEKAQPSTASSGSCNANNLISLTRTQACETVETDVLLDNGAGTGDWKDWGNVRMSYYARDSESAKDSTAGPSNRSHASQVPSTPTPIRRHSGHSSSKLGRDSTADESPVTGTPPSTNKSDEVGRGMSVLEISSSEVLSRGVEEIMKEYIDQVPNESRYELLHRVRSAYALAKSDETRQQILAIRMLSLTNLAYVYPENILQQKILLQDSDEPKRLQIAYQLAEFVHLGVAGDINASVLNQTFALGCLEVLSRHKTKSAEVCAALNVNVNHGILMFIIRKTVADLANPDEFNSCDDDNWRDALFSLLRAITGSGVRSPEAIVSAGLVPMLVDILNLRTEKARRIYPRVMEFLDTYVHPVRDALSNLASAKGFDALSSLISHEAKSAFHFAKEGNGIPEDFKNAFTDYQIPYFHQQSLRWLFKFVNHVMQHNSGGFERLLRNFIDSPPLLYALRLVIENARIYGSHVWSGAVNVMSHFIHNEPTSYAVIAEAGLSKSFLEAVMAAPIKSSSDEAANENPSKFNPNDPNADAREIVSQLVTSHNFKGSDGILASSEAIVCIPLAFGAICLNSTGLELFESSEALDRFFDIFESPEHLQAMKSDPNLLRALGNSFDELIRHHPRLKTAVTGAIVRMVARVRILAASKAWECGLGAKLLKKDESGNIGVIGGAASVVSEVGAPFTEDLDAVSGSAVSLGEGVQANDLPPHRYPDIFGPTDTSKWNLMENKFDTHGLSVLNYIYPALKFLSAFFENQTMCANFMDFGGTEFLLDYATLPSFAHDFHSCDLSRLLAQNIKIMSETRSHLVLPSVINRTQKALTKVSRFYENWHVNGFFAPVTSSVAGTEDPENVRSEGTYFVKHLAALLTLTAILRTIFSPNMYAVRPSHQVSPFSYTNLTDKLTVLVQSLGRLQSALVWEEILLQVIEPAGWKGRFNPDSFPDIGIGFDQPSFSIPSLATGGNDTDAPQSTSTEANVTDPVLIHNNKVIRYLATTLPLSITSFHHALGHGLTNKRRMDSYQRQKATKVADAMAAMILEQLQKAPDSKASDRFSYLVIILSTFMQLLFETAPSHDRNHSHCLTIILNAFKKVGGINTLHNLIDLFLGEIKSLSHHPKENLLPSMSQCLASASGCVKLILTFFSESLSARYILDSLQTQVMANEQYRDRPDPFIPGQFLVEMRMEAVPLIQKTWESDFINDASGSMVKSLVGIIRSVLEGECENGAYHRGDTPPLAGPPPVKAFSFNSERLSVLCSRYDENLSKEALYRCNNSLQLAEEYCAAHKGLRPPPRLPVPSSDIEIGSRVSTTPPNESLFGTIAPTAVHASDGASGSSFSQIFGGPVEAVEGLLDDFQDMPIGQSSSAAEANDNTNAEGSSADQSTATSTALPTTRTASPLKRREVVTVEDLDKERDRIRSGLIERCLEVLNLHHDVTFELADLINSATKPSRDGVTLRKEIGETLVHSLISLQMDENFQSGGKKIAAYANLLALVLQDESVYEATLEQLKENFSLLLGFITIPNSQVEKSTGEACPWIAQVLLIIERIISDDEEPQQVPWIPAEDEFTNRPRTQPKEPIIPLDEKVQLFEAILDVLPRIGKDDSLALSICRIFVILTRYRVIAERLGERKNLQRLFVMIKQLADSANEKLQSSFMLVLRHIIEDEETVRQILRNEVVTYFEARAPRQIETGGYIRQFYHLIARAPRMFIDVTNDNMKIARYESRSKSQMLILKNKDNKELTPSEEKPEDDTDQEKKLEHSQDAKPDVSHDEDPDAKAKPKIELKTPIVEHPDGVIHYLLSELLSYRDVEDKEVPTAPAENAENQLSEDVDMVTDSSSTHSASLSRTQTKKKSDKPHFKAEDHPIYIYRCFLLQCLTELLSSYNRTKVEFINFSRKADPLATTPSKPRSTILNYLLQSLIPIGTLEHQESIWFKKQLNTSHWAMRVVVSLCSKTGEVTGSPKRRPNFVEEEDEPELMFVRKFVLEHALKAFKEANSSTEPLDAKYARLMCLADLFDKMLSGVTNPDGTPHFPSSTRFVAKMMFEKNFISAFTSSVADIDLNFPSSKRAVKYILRPLNKLTQTAVLLSEAAAIAGVGAPGVADEDEISSASSVSEIDEDREETPDLFRHSTLGMFEPEPEDQTPSEDDEEDDEMYDDDEYDEEMEYEEELPENDGEVVSEDEDIDGRGPIEGLPGDAPMDIEVLIESDEDDDDDEDGDDEEEDDDEDDDGEDDSDLAEEVIAGEITGDRDNDSLHGGDDDEWGTDSDDDDVVVDEMMGRLGEGLENLAQGNPAPHFDELLRVLENAGSAPHGDSEIPEIPGLAVHDELVDDDDLNEEEDEEEEIDELEDDADDYDDQGFHGFADDDDVNSPWSWVDEAITPRRSHWGMFSGFTGGSRHTGGGLPSYRTHRTHLPAAGNDDGTNPLLRRRDRPGHQQANADAYSDWVHAIDPNAQGRLLAVDSPISFMNAILQMIGQGGPGLGLVTRPDGFHLHIDPEANLPSRLQDLLGLSRPQGATSRPRDDPAQSISFKVSTTVSRWQEEARILFGNAYSEKCQRVANALLELLVPPAVEENRRLEEEYQENVKRREEEEKEEREEKERIAKEKAEEEQKRKEEEEAERQRQEAEHAAEESASQTVVAEHMDDVQPAESGQEPQESAAAPDAGTSEPPPRVHTTIRGRQLDITDMDIDPEFLEAIPEEFREEVIMQQLAEQRSHAAAAGEEPSEINPEFLEALPPEIRDELLQQEAADRRRRERETARRQGIANGAPHAEDIDPASFIATLDPSLRRTVLADQPEEVLAALGPEFLSEARALAGGRPGRFDTNARANAQNRVDTSRQEDPSKKPPRRQIVQMLDKAGVATLLRLMFTQLQGNARHNLNDILHNVCQNRQNRAEVLSLLLLILQDGSADILAIERSFAHLSLRAKTPTTQKTPQLKRTLSLPSPGTNGDVTPLVVIQQCLGTLAYLTQYNPHIPWFFLTEHDTHTALKFKSFRKAKAKDNRASKYALNALLSLLDRKAILDSPNCMEQLSGLLSSITQPLSILLKKEKERLEEEVKALRAEAEKREAPEQLNAEGSVQNAQDNGVKDDTTMTDAGPSGTEQGSGGSQKQSGGADQGETKQKKQRPLEPPVIPQHNLRLVVHILAARECNAKVFRETLSTINNVSSVPGAKEVIGKELVQQAQALSQTILLDLSELLPHIIAAKRGTDVQGIALSKFSPASSDQAKLLRVLTALDYLFDPARGDKDKAAGSSSSEKENVLRNLYGSATFGPLWNKLSECLSTIRKKENMLNVATTLLPLIESLMVVCKNTTLRDLPLSRHGREFSVSSPPPESGTEGLFFAFTEEHRKILNELVRQNPRLMSGTFSLLVKNPKVLEFDNKRNYFNRRIHSRGSEARHPHPPLQLSVRRDQVFLDSFKSLYFKSADEMKYGKLNIRFHGEEGVDAGGVTREWFQVLARGMFNPNYALFIPVASDRTTFHPNRLSGVNSEHLMFFKFIGRIIGKALYEGRVLDCHFSRAVYKRILGRQVSIKDMETLDLDYYKSLLWMLENDITDILTENFSVEVEDFGEKQVIDLIENGRNIPVTQENKEEYVQHVVDHRLVGSVKEQLGNFLKGFHEIIPAELISIFNEQELELLISGLPEIDVDDWKSNTEYHNYSASSPQIQWFWRAVRSFDKEERAKLLQFVTGTSKVPLNGFRELEGMNGFSKFNIHRDYGNKERLPSSHTCFNQLDLPEYESYETLRQRLYTAMTAGSEYFGFA